MQKIAKKLKKTHDYLYYTNIFKKPHFRGGREEGALQQRPPWYKTPLPHNVYYVDIWTVFGIGGVLYHGGTISLNHSVLVDNKKKMVILIPKSKKLFNIRKYFCQIITIHCQALKNKDLLHKQESHFVGQIWGHILYLNARALLTWNTVCAFTITASGGFICWWNYS